MADSVTGVIWPPVVALGEETEAAWEGLFQRAQQAGLALGRLRGVTSDGSHGLLAYLRHRLAWVQHHRCVWHIWRTLGGELARAAWQGAEGLSGEAAEQTRKQVRAELGGLLHQIIDAKSYDQAEAALATLQGHPLGATLGQWLNVQLDRVLVYLLDYYRGLQRVTPEWCWRDFRLRLSRGRNHGSDPRLERAGVGLGYLSQLHACSMEV